MKKPSKRRSGDQPTPKPKPVRPVPPDQRVGVSDVVLVRAKGTPGKGAGPGGEAWSIVTKGVKSGRIFINWIDEPPVGPHASIQIYLNRQEPRSGHWAHRLPARQRRQPVPNDLRPHAEVERALETRRPSGWLPRRDAARLHPASHALGSSAVALMDVAVVIPCLNEQETIAATARSLGFGEGVDPPAGAQLVLVDNGSSDGTWDVMGRVAAEAPSGVVQRIVEGERGFVPPRDQGVRHAALLAAERGCQADQLLILQADADTEYLPHYIERMRGGRGRGYTVGSLHWPGKTRRSEARELPRTRA